MPPFTSINDVDAVNSNQAVEEPDMRETNDKERAAEYATAALAELSDSVPKE